MINLLSNFLDVNTTVVERLLPVFESSPLVQQFRGAAPPAFNAGSDEFKLFDNDALNNLGLTSSIFKTNALSSFRILHIVFKKNRGWSHKNSQFYRDLSFTCPCNLFIATQPNIPNILADNESIGTIIVCQHFLDG